MFWTSCLFLCTHVVLAMSPDDWYKRYPAYHPYCSTRQDMATRSIPEVANDPRLGESRLIHATVIVRHGARTPWTALDCWDGYTPVSWDCNLTTYLATPPPQRIAQEEGYVSPNGQSGTVLFEKRYDALQDPGDNLSNVLNGTCQQGQLILQGYEQELQNGQFLRDAYVYSSSTGSGSASHNDRMKLLDTAQSVDTLFRQLYYRVDDDQRTLMSGQVVLRGLFGPELIDHWEKSNGQHPVLPLHTADRAVDILDPNEKRCERLQEIRERYQHSAEYQTFAKSNETKLLERFWKDVLGRKLETSHNNVIDCLFTTMCTDRELPEAIDDYEGNYTNLRKLQQYTTYDTALGNFTSSNDDDDDISSSSSDDEGDGYGNHLFERLYRYGKMPYRLLYEADNAEYSKAGMAPLWAEIMSQIYAVTHEPTYDCCPPVRGEPAKLALYAGHDTTIMPLLASLGPGVWDGEWPPYASMVALEIHQVHIDGNTDKTLYRSNYAFRLIYNGEILTHRIDGCSKDAQICDVQLLIDQVRSFATRHYDCKRKFPLTITHEDTVSRVKKIVSTPEGIAAVVVVLLGSFLAGVASACFCVRRGKHPRRPKRTIKVATEEEDPGDVSLTGNSHHGDDNGVVAAEGSGYEDEPDAGDDLRYGSIT